MLWLHFFYKSAIYFSASNHFFSFVSGVLNFVFCVFVCVLVDSHMKKEDTLVLKLGSLSMAPQADNPLTRTVLRKDIYQ